MFSGNVAPVGQKLLLTGKLLRLISTYGSFGMWQGNNPLSFEYLKANKSLDEIYRLKPTGTNICTVIHLQHAQSDDEAVKLLQPINKSHKLIKK